MILDGFAGRTVRQVERDDASLRVIFEDGGYLYVRARPESEGVTLKVSCNRTRCEPATCEECRGIQPAASD